MLKPANLVTEIRQLLIKDTSNTDLLQSIITGKEQIYLFIRQKSMKRPAGRRRMNCLRMQLSSLVMLADLLYMEAHYEKIRAIRKALVVTLQLIEEVNGLLDEPEPRVLLPKALLSKARKKHGGSKQYLRALFATHQIDPELARLALLPLKNLLETPEGHLYTYRDYIYLGHYLDVLFNQDFEEAKGAMADAVLCDALILANFNKMLFGKYYIQKLRCALGDCSDPSEKLKMLRAEKKRVGAMDIVSALTYDHRFVSLKAYIITWLREEAASLRKLKS